MNKIIVLIMFVLSANLFADTGKAYRILMDIEMNHQNTKGYVFYYTYSEEIPNKDDLISFLKFKNQRKKIRLYSQIKSIKNIDFSIKKYETEIIVNDILSISVDEIMEFVPDQRLVLLEEKEYILIDEENYETKTIDLGISDFYENCIHVLLSEKNNNYLKEEEDKLSHLSKSKYKELGTLEGEKRELYYEFLSDRKKYLLEKQIVLFTFCSAL